MLRIIILGSALFDFLAFPLSTSSSLFFLQMLTLHDTRLLDIWQTHHMQTCDVDNQKCMRRTQPVCESILPCPIDGERRHNHVISANHLYFQYRAREAGRGAVQDANRFMLKAPKHHEGSGDNRARAVGESLDNVISFKICGRKVDAVAPVWLKHINARVFHIQKKSATFNCCGLVFV